MDHNHFHVSVIVIGCISGLSYNSHASENHISLKKAMATRLITVNAVSTGGYCDKSLKLELINNTKNDLNVDIDPGLIFKPEDTALQDLVVLGNETIVLTPNKQSNISLQTFCGKSYGRGPSPAHIYHYWKQGDSNLIKTLCYVKANHINISLAQKAVWAFTNGYCLNTIYSAANSTMSEDFAQYVASLKNSRLPEYFVDYKLDNTAGHSVIMTDKMKVYATMHWSADEGYRHMRLTIYKENGDVYKQIEADRVIDKYGYTVKVEFDPKKDPKGIYLVTIHDDANKIWDHKKVIIGARACDML